MYVYCTRTLPILSEYSSSFALYHQWKPKDANVQRQSPHCGERLIHPTSIYNFWWMGSSSSEVPQEAGWEDCKEEEWGLQTCDSSHLYQSEILTLKECSCGPQGRKRKETQIPTSFFCCFQYGAWSYAVREFLDWSFLPLNQNVFNKFPPFHASCRQDALLLTCFYYPLFMNQILSFFM